MEWMERYARLYVYGIPSGCGMVMIAHEVVKVEWKVSPADTQHIQLLRAVDEDGPQEIGRRGQSLWYRSTGAEKPGRNRLAGTITSGPTRDHLELDRIPGVIYASSSA